MPQPNKFLSELEKIYRQVDLEIAGADYAHQPCLACGKCCKFDQVAHRLYLSAGELAYLSQAGKKPAAENRCPYQVDNLCTAGEFRPLGCRIYFCKPTSKKNFDELYEKYHQQIRQLHHKHNIPYTYTELTSAIG